MISELEIDVRSREEWRGLRQAMPELFDEGTGARLAQHVAAHGLSDPFSGPIPASRVSISSDNFRESIIADGINSRQRAVLMCLGDELARRGKSCKVYASEAISPLAQRLKKHVPGFSGSEYLPELTDRARHPTLMHQNILELSFADASFDGYISCDVLEHIPDLQQAINEAARILRPGGFFLGTVPFAAGHEETIVRAVLTHSGIEHLEEPQYHGNPTRPEEGSLVFQIPGWDLMDMCRKAGFEDPCMRLIVSKRHGVFSNAPGFISLFYAKRPA